MLDVEESPERVVGKAKMALAKNRHSFTIIFDFHPAGNETTAVVTLEMNGNKQDAVFKEVADATGQDNIAGHVVTRPDADNMTKLEKMTA